MLNITFPFNLTNPDTIPTHDTDPVVYPVALTNLTNTTAHAIVSEALSQVLDIIHDSGASSNCSRCIAALSVGQMAARLAPMLLPDAMIALCKTTKWASNSSCQNTYEAGSFGAPWTQILAKADVTGQDGRFICSYLSGTFCSQPAVIPVKAKFPKPKPTKIKKPCRSGKRAKVLHLSDLHLDPRYVPGSEGNCTASMCCRPSPPSTGNSTAIPEITDPASIWGYYKCDSPYYLALAALQSIQPLTNTSAKEPPALTLYTGDLVAHDPQVQRSQAYVENVQDSIWQMFKAYIGGPIYVALGNHDTNPDNLDAPHAIDDNGPLGQQFSWNYDHVSALWKHYGWIDDEAVKDASLHYGGYAITHPTYPNLRIITLNTDLWYKNNMYTFINTADPDFSGIFTFLIDELQKAEDAGQAVWIVGHVLTGWSGSNPMPSAADLFYQIIDRYSHVVRAAFFGHTHEDQINIFYTNNGTIQSADTAIGTAWIGPSLTPLTNLNSGYRLYEVDTGSWEIFDAYTFYADVNSFSSLEGVGPTFQLEYSTRATYGPAADWPEDAPLNATFWHKVTEAMEADSELVRTFNRLQSKSSVRTPPCTSDACVKAKICYMRSGSAALGKGCPQGFDSTQSAYTGKG